MNINLIHKQYDKLTANERFALLVAAGVRGDHNEREVLLQSSPIKTWRVPAVRGLGEAFSFLTSWHVMSQLGHAAKFYRLLAMHDEDGVSNFFNVGMAELKHIITGAMAWRAICEEYGVDYEKILEGLPFIEIMILTEIHAMRIYDNKPFELSELHETIDELREVIETKRKDWE